MRWIPFRKACAIRTALTLMSIPAPSTTVSRKIRSICRFFTMYPKSTARGVEWEHRCDHICHWADLRCFGIRVQCDRPSCRARRLKHLLKLRPRRPLPQDARLQSMAMQGMMRRRAVQCNAMQCNAMQRNATQRNAMQCNAMQCTLAELGRRSLGRMLSSKIVIAAIETSSSGSSGTGGVVVVILRMSAPWVIGCCYPC